MSLRISILLCALLGACTGTVSTGPATPYRPPPPDRGPDRPPPSAPAWDSRGWELLGSSWVDGRSDRDVIRVGSAEGPYDKLTMVVTESDVEMLDFVVTFGNGERWSPKLKHRFREGERARAIDLPGDIRRIREIQISYANLPGGGRAKVEIYGHPKDRPGGQPTPPVPPPPPPSRDDWDPKGWTLLGSQAVDGKRDRDVYKVGRTGGKFDRIMLVVKESDLELVDFVVTFENGTKVEPKLRHTFREGARTRGIDLPGDVRLIRQIDVQYGNLRGGGRARLEIYGREVTKPGGAPPPPPSPSADTGWNPANWTLIASGTVEGKRDRDLYQVGKQKGKFKNIMVVVKDSDLELYDFVVTFENGEKFEPKLRHTFKENTRTKAIDLPGEARLIRSVEVRYANLPGGGRASVQIYAK